MPSIRVAVCTNRTPHDVAECLKALGAQGARVILVTSGLDGPAIGLHQQALDHLVPDATLLVEPQTGLSVARNRALAVCDDDEVIAYVDDDAVVADDWLERLSAAWDAAPDDVACIGGPIRPRFPDGRPAWLSDVLLDALTVLDYGPEQQDLDLSQRTLYGANISFRAGPLRAVGGFNPAWGHRGAEVWFSEDDEAQRALDRAGYRVRYVPDVTVDHLLAGDRLTRSALIARRYRYGASLRARDARGAGVAIRQLARSAPGAVIAALRGDGTRAMERAMRAAENVGALAGPPPP